MSGLMRSSRSWGGPIGGRAPPGCQQTRVGAGEAGKVRIEACSIERREGRGDTGSRVGGPLARSFIDASSADQLEADEEVTSAVRMRDDPV